MTDPTTLTRELVAIPSHESEAAAGDFIEEWLQEHTDATVTRDNAGSEEDRGGNVIARMRFGEDSNAESGENVDADSTSLALVGHHDVVPPDNGYSIKERDGRLYGRGTADMKGALAAAMCAFRDVDPGPAVKGGEVDELVFASFVGEEVGGVGARYAIDQGFAPDYAIVIEGSTGYSSPGTTDVAVAHKGRRGSSITAHGTAAHASEIDQGTNAIYRATDAVDIVRDLDFPSTTVLGHELAGTVAVTEIDGGSAWNVIPEHCVVTVDERTVPGERADLAQVEDVDGVEWTVDQDLPPMACSDGAFAEAVLDVAADVQDSQPEHVVKPHATDAGWLTEAGTACVICGVAEPGEAHTATESVSLAVIERCYEIYRLAAERISAYTVGHSS